jgi:hypothetical protein
MKLERHSVWDLYDDRTSSLEKFIENFVPAMKLRKEVSEDVIKTYKIIKSLIIHSYYEYEFIDVAFTKMLQTFEMALKIRYRELNEKEWSKNKRLADLIEWFRTKEYFEVNQKEYMDHIRNARNAFSHPQSHSFGGIALFHWFDTITDLINDIHEDVENRKKRFAEIKLLNESIKDLIKNGSKINLKGESHLIYDAGVLFVEEIDGVKSCIFYYKRLYELDENANFLPNQKPPYQLIELKNFDFTFSEKFCRFGLFSISIISESEEREIFTQWMERFKTNAHYSAYDAILGIQIQNCFEKRRRESIHSKYFND